jgi:hypothetical protein
MSSQYGRIAGFERLAVGSADAEVRRARAVERESEWHRDRGRAVVGEIERSAGRADIDERECRGVVERVARQHVGRGPRRGERPGVTVRVRAGHDRAVVLVARTGRERDVVVREHRADVIVAERVVVQRRRCVVRDRVADVDRIADADGEVGDGTALIRIAVVERQRDRETETVGRAASRRARDVRRRRPDRIGAARGSLVEARVRQRLRRCRSGKESQDGNRHGPADEQGRSHSYLDRIGAAIATVAEARPQRL